MVVLPLADGRRRLPLLEERAGDRRWRPIIAVWELTLRCDLACHHCGSRAGHARGGELSTEEALDLVAQLRALEVTEVTLIGGEAYLRDDWTTIARAITEAGMICTLTTGGRGLSPERAALAKAAGVRSASVSVDGTAATHDALRGVAGSHASALAAIAHLRAAGVPVSANTQVGARNRHELPRLFEELVAAGIHSWQVMLTAAMGRAADDPSLLLQPWELLELMPIIADLKLRADAADVRLLPGNNLGYFGPYESLLRGILPRGHTASCGAGLTTLGIEAHGDVKGCPSLPSEAYVGGNLREHSLRDIWERTAPLRFARDRGTGELWGYCRSCYYADECRAGCSWTAHVLLGRRGNNPYCHHRALELLRIGKRETIARSEAAPGTPFDHGEFAITVEDLPPAELARLRALTGAPSQGA